LLTCTKRKRTKQQRMKLVSYLEQNSGERKKERKKYDSNAVNGMDYGAVSF
jgi:hypothetical protein